MKDYRAPVGFWRLPDLGNCVMFRHQVTGREFGIRWDRGTPACVQSEINREGYRMTHP